MNKSVKSKKAIIKKVSGKKSTYSLDHIAKVGELPYTNPTALYLPPLFKYHLENNTTFSVESFSGQVKTKIDDIEDYLISLKAIKIYKTSTAKAFKFYNSLLVHSISTNNSITVNFYSNDAKADEAFKHIKDNFLSDSKKDLVFSIVKDGAELKVKNIGKADLPLVEDNYTTDVIEDYKYICKSFNKKEPNGRICILNGPPGTGKSSLIRASLSDIDAISVIIPSNMVSSLDKPELLPLLLDTKTTYNKPMILIIEDGDACLVPRKADNMSVIASLLNLSDGIIGSLIDIRMIISTNAEINDMDEAIMRPGRLCKNINIDPLPYDHANRVYQRIINSTEKSLEKADNYTLAEIYAIANNADLPEQKINVIKKPKKVIGFGFQPDSIMNSK